MCASIPSGRRIVRLPIVSAKGIATRVLMMCLAAPALVWLGQSKR